MNIACYDRGGAGVLVVSASTLDGDLVLHESDEFPLDPKHPTARAEIEWANQKTGAPYPDLYDAIRAAIRQTWRRPRRGGHDQPSPRDEGQPVKGKVT